MKSFQYFQTDDNLRSKLARQLKTFLKVETILEETIKNQNKPNVSFVFVHFSELPNKSCKKPKYYRSIQ